MGPWLGEYELEQKLEQMQELRQRFAAHKISNSLFFGEVERLEPEIQRLQAEREQHSIAAQRAAQDVTDIRRRWYSDTDDDRLDVSQKRTYIREALHAVIVHPAGKGRRPFNPDLLELRQARADHAAQAARQAAGEPEPNRTTVRDNWPMEVPRQRPPARRTLLGRTSPHPHPAGESHPQPAHRA